MNSTKTLLAAGLALLMAGCGTVGNAVVSDDELARKAAFALDTTADKVTVSDRTAEVSGAINYVATTRGRKHQCYITSMMGAVNSSAVCSGANSVNTSGKCNDLQRAAGQCR